MAKDPAVLWYWNDWHGGTITFSRHLKGCYMDLLHAQFNSGRLSLAQIKTVLGVDFGNAWPLLQEKFKRDDNDKYYNEKAENEKERRRLFTESRRKNLKTSHMEPHMKAHKEAETENKTEARKGGSGENRSESPEIYTIEHCLTVAMADPRWVRANKTSEKELGEFNRLLEKRGVYDKNPGDYKNHFANWKLSGKSDQALSAPEGKPGPSARELKGSNIINT